MWLRGWGANVRIGPLDPEPWSSGFRRKIQAQGYLRQCAHVPVISTTDSFAANPLARAAAFRLCAIGAAGISPTEPHCSQIRNAAIAAASWSCAQARKALRLSIR